MIWLILIPGILAGVGVALLISGLIPQQPGLAAALDRLGTTTASSAAGAPNLESRVGSWVQRRLPETRPLAIPEKDLALVGKSVNKYLFDKTMLAVLGLIALPVFGLFVQVIAGWPFYLPALAGIPVAIALWFAPDQDVRSNAAKAREEFKRSVAVYLELVAAERRRGAPAGHALLSAAEVGESQVFIRIRQELTRASIAGTPPWDALMRFSDEIGVPELGEVGKIIRLSGEDGAAVYETLRARGKSLRVQLLNDEQTRANEASERMTLPMTALAMIFVGIILTPLMMNLLTT